MNPTLRKFKLEYLKQLISVGIILGFIFGVGKALLFINSNRYIELEMYNIAFYYLWSMVNYFSLIFPLFFIVFCLIILFLYFVLTTFLKNEIKGKIYTQYTVLTILLIGLFLISGYRLNSSLWFPGFFSTKGFIFNMVITLFFIFLGFTIFKILPIIHKFLSYFVLKIFGFRFVFTSLFYLLLGIVLISNISISSLYNFKSYPDNNIIVLLIDCLRADHLSSYGYSLRTTPNIDNLSKDSVIFTQAISQGTYTKTSIASLFTSLNPYLHGVYKGNWRDSKNNITSDVLGKEETTLAEVLLQNGFLTMAWIGQTELSSSSGFEQGFVEYNEQQYEIKDINNSFTKWIKGNGKKHKFFTYIHYVDLHEPYRPKPPYDTMYGVFNKDIYSGIDFKKWGYHLKEINDKIRVLEKKDVDQLIAYYNGLVTYIDSQVGLLLKELKEAGLYDSTLIILTSDHGDGFMEHGFISHSNTPYEELVRVPLIIKFPNSRHGGKVVKSQVRLIDIMPTIYDLFKIRVENKLEGFSLLNYLNNEDKDSKMGFPNYAYSENATDSGYPTLSIRTKNLKYIHFQYKEDELYDLSVDPKEQNNIIDLKSVEAEKFRKMVVEMILERKKKGDVEKVILDKEKIEKLKSLGYIQ